MNDETETGEVVEQEACVAGGKSNRILSIMADSGEDDLSEVKDDIEIGD